jgi:hypothetical protein
VCLSLSLSCPPLPPLHPTPTFSLFLCLSTSVSFPPPLTLVFTLSLGVSSLQRYCALSEAYSLQKEKLQQVLLQQQKEAAAVPSFSDARAQARVGLSSLSSPSSSSSSSSSLSSSYSHSLAATATVQDHPTRGGAPARSTMEEAVATAASAAAHNQMRGKLLVGATDTHFWTFAQSTIMLAVEALQRCETVLVNQSSSYLGMSPPPPPYDEHQHQDQHQQQQQAALLQQVAAELADARWVLCHCAYPIPATQWREQQERHHQPTVQRLVEHMGKVLENSSVVRRKAEAALGRARGGNSDNTSSDTGNWERVDHRRWPQR